jgi:hypothetical protein
MLEYNEYILAIDNVVRHMSQDIAAIESALKPLQSSLVRLKAVIPVIRSLRADSGSLITSVDVSHEVLAVADGQNVCENDMLPRHYNDFDIILDLPNHLLKVRLDPKNKSELIDCSISHLGRRRMKLLVYVLEYPKSRICAEMIDNIYQDGHEIEPNTLSKSIGSLREVVHQDKPDANYIMTEKDPAEIHSMTGHFYQMNPKWRYLVIMKNIDKSSQIPQQRAHKLPSDEF